MPPDPVGDDDAADGEEGGEKADPLEGLRAAFGAGGPAAEHGRKVVSFSLGCGEDVGLILSVSSKMTICWVYTNLLTCSLFFYIT